MPKTLKINKSVEQGVRDILKFLLVNDKVKAVFTLKKINKNGAVAYSLITDPNALEDALPFYPLMPGNAGKLLSHFTLNGSVPEPVAVVVRPCELRAFVELVKRIKANLENLLIISSTCGGVYPLDMATNGNIEKNISNYWDAVKKGNIPRDIRPSCKGCEHFIPNKHADMIVDLIGNENIDKQCTIFLNSDKGEKFTEGMEGWSLEEGKLDTEKINKARSKREEEKKKLFDNLGGEELGLEGLVQIFGKCIGCRNCRAVCPICYCQLCNFDSQNTEYTLSQKELDRKGGMRIPPNTIYFHLLRMAHISISCVACGACEDACPADIPISCIFKMVSEPVQEMFDYLPGRDVEEEIPLKTFGLEEFKEVED